MFNRCVLEIHISLPSKTVRLNNSDENFWKPVGDVKFERSTGGTEKQGRGALKGGMCVSF